MTSLRSRRAGPLAGAGALAAFALVHACNAPPSRAPEPPRAVDIADASSSSTSLAPRACVAWTAPKVDAPPTEAGESARRAKATRPSDTCETADDNLARAEREIRAASKSRPASKVSPWDHRRAPVHMPRVDARLVLTRAERAGLTKNGFVVSERFSFDTYAWAFHEIYQSELPLWFSADALLHAVYASNDNLIADLEVSLERTLGAVLSAMHCALPAAAAGYPPDVARDLDMYLTVARSLLSGAPTPSVLGTDVDAARAVAAASGARGITTEQMFGRPRLVDWSQYLPRGHYVRGKATDDGGPPPRDLSRYFRAVMWLSRLELNLVSRSSRSSAPGPTPDPRETPREALAALALADLVDRAGQNDAVSSLERAFSALGGRREDVSISDLRALRAQAKIARIDDGAFAALKAAIGTRFQRTARLHPMPQGSDVLPAITTFLGARVTADSSALRPLVDAETPARKMVGAADVAFVLGLDHARTYLARDLAAYPALGPNLQKARALVSAAPDPGDLYSAWLGALRRAAGPVDAAAPSFMKTPAYQDARLSTITAGYAQLRHAYVLLAGQPYDEGGCEIPDGFVEPVPDLYDAVAEYARRGEKLAQTVAPADARARGYFARLREVAEVLAIIARDELAGRALTDAQRRFLSMVVEMVPGGTGGPPTYTGWYFDIFRGREVEALTGASLVADYYTSGDAGLVAYVGASRPRLGVFVVDVGGAPRVMVGPVANAYELTSSVDRRLDDAAAERAADKQAPWSASHVVSRPPEPRVGVRVNLSQQRAPARGVEVVVQAIAAQKGVRVELLDHHRRVLGGATSAVGIGETSVWVKGPRDVERVEGVRVRVGEATAEGFRAGPSDTVEASLGGPMVSAGP
ncbi:MAG: DUF3160 domain-containing protein [Myxococcales bacterium]|nr:DUF3160 domain-containing protein [Myxococcales bacterium]